MKYSSERDRDSEDIMVYSKRYTFFQNLDLNTLH
jgi:hypothetical protein